MPASLLDLTIEQGAIFSQEIAIDEAYNGLTPVAQIRDRVNGSLIAALTCSVVAAGATTISMTAEQTAALAVYDDPRPDLRAVLLGSWDMLTTGVRHVQGRVTLSRRITVP